jgi:hypothetical protein
MQGVVIDHICKPIWEVEGGRVAIDALWFSITAVAEILAYLFLAWAWKKAQMEVPPESGVIVIHLKPGERLDSLRETIPELPKRRFK